MKKYLTILITVFSALFICCTKNDPIEIVDPTRNINDSIRHYGSIENIWLNLTYSEWFTKLDERIDNDGDYRGLGQVFLIISGSTNADSVTVIDYGYGLYHEEEIFLDDLKNFSMDTTNITKEPVSCDWLIVNPELELERETKISAYKNKDTLVIPFKSGKLKLNSYLLQDTTICE